jgi:UDP-N-acetylglucosamine 4,6-dehydratase (inverting)
MLNGKSILITGGTGSFGQAFVAEVLRRFPEIERLVIFSRDELKQYEMALIYPVEEYRALRYFIGDVRDRNRLIRALNGIDIVIHAAALKQVPTAEYNPMEFIHTNVLGAENVIETAADANIENVISLSTDKAAAPINMYGATKLCSDKLFVAANHYLGTKTKFTVVRYGNVLGSRGSLFPFFLNKAKGGVLPITDPSMTRFNITLRDGVNLVLWALENTLGGEICVPKCPSYRLRDVAEAIGPTCRQEIIGVRPGEKIHEEMITESDSNYTVELSDRYIILPTTGRLNIDEYIRQMSATAVEPGFSYNSGRNSEFLSVEQLRALIRDYIDPAFQPI